MPQVVARLEAVLSQKRFTQLGGLQLEKDVRLLVGEWAIAELSCHHGPSWQHTAPVMQVAGTGRRMRCIVALASKPNHPSPLHAHPMQRGCPT